MKKTKKIMALVMAGLMAASMTACQTKTEPQPTGGQESESASAEAQAGTEAPAAAGKTYKIGIIQLTQHAALDKTNEGFVAALKDAGLDCEIDQQNASGDQSACQTIAETLVNNGNDLIFAIATPAAQAVAGVTETIPFSAARLRIRRLPVLWRAMKSQTVMYRAHPT